MKGIRPEAVMTSSVLNQYGYMMLWKKPQNGLPVSIIMEPMNLPHKLIDSRRKTVIEQSTMMALNSDVYVCLLAESLQRKAAEELNEQNSVQRQDAIDAVRQWMLQHDYMKRTDNTFILSFLRVCKFDYERTIKKIEQNYSFRAALPDWLAWKDPEDSSVQSLIRLGIYIPVNYNNVTGSRVLIVRVGVADPGNVIFEDILKLERMISELILMEDQAQVAGIEVIVDMNGYTIKHMSYYTPNIIMTYTKLMKVVPVRIKGIHFLNAPLISRGLLAFAKFLMPAKLKSRFNIHGNMDDLHQIIPKSCLPEEYGGHAGALSEFNARNEANIMGNKDYLQLVFNEHTARVKNSNTASCTESAKQANES